MAATEEISGRVAAIIWQADDGSAVIARLDNRMAVKGKLIDSDLVVGLTYRFHGRRVRDDRYGEQFAFETYSLLAPADRRGVITYLQQVCDAVGEKRAERLWQAFKGDAVRTLREQPEKVIELGIMSGPDAMQASQCLHNEGAFETVKVELLGLFAGRGFQAGRVIRESIRLWGARAPERIKRNPYLLMLRKLPGCGFNRCDKLYRDLKLPPGKLKRQMLCGWHHLRSDTSGHTWHQVKRVGGAIVEAIGTQAEPVKALRLGIRSHWLARVRVNEETWIAEHAKAHAEQSLARDILALVNWEPSWKRKHRQNRECVGR